MDLFAWLLGAVLVGGAVTLVTNVLKVNSLMHNFAALGTLAGRPRAEIIAAVGEPTSVSQLGEGATLEQWIHNSPNEGYHIALRFKDEVCEGVTHETHTKT